MFTMTEMLSEANQKAAFEFLATKKDGCGLDGIRLSELKDYWKLNRNWIEAELLEGNYQPGVLKCFEIVNSSGKKRTVSMMGSVDRLITRLMLQKFRQYFEINFLKNNYSYQQGKRISDAVMQAKSFAESGNIYVSKIDIKDFFGSIPLEKMYQKMSKKLSDRAVLTLLRRYLFCDVLIDNKIITQKKGLIPGSPLSPFLSNIYLQKLDEEVEIKGYKWIRFADDIAVFSCSWQQAEQIFENVCNTIKIKHQLNVNEKKSGVYKIFGLRLLGYDFYRNKDKIGVKKHLYQKEQIYYNWHQCAVQKLNSEYHILQDGILNKKDYALLFENKEEKHFIPVEVTDKINLYGNVTVTSNVLQTISKKKICLSFFDRYGNLMGNYIPEGYSKSSATLLKQCQVYSNTEQRLLLARQMEIASLHNMRANLRYYNKKEREGLKEKIQLLSGNITGINEAVSINKMMLLEARARETYYSAFNEILNNEEFYFTRRTKRPPKDELNALISFGNTVLYNLFLQIIEKSSLDSRIGAVHAANRRAHSLNLDFADIFKPIIVDRIIFTLVNCRQLKKDFHFQKVEDGGIYLNVSGKKIYIEEFEKKISSKICIKGNTYSYRQIMEKEVHQYEKYILTGEKYRPYKYY